MDGKWLKLVLQIGLPVLAFGLMNGVAFLLQQRFINMLGIVAAAAFSIGFVIINVIDAAFFGLGNASAIMVGQSLGANNPKRAREVAFKTTLLIFVLVLVGASIMYPLRRPIADVFADDAKVIDETERFLQTLLPTLPFFGLCVNVMSIGRGSGHTIFPTTIEIGRIWVIRVILGYFLAFIVGMGPAGSWSAFALSNVVGGTILAFWIKYGKWDKTIIRNTYTPRTTDKATTSS